MGASAAGLAVSGAASSKGGKKPNIVFILADDQGRHQLNCYGNPFYETPHIDALAAQGIKFTDAYAACPVCSPTRASIMTGKYPARLHITDYIPGNAYPHAKLKTPDWSKQLPLEEITIAEMLKEAGYVSGHFGKWHLDEDNRFSPGRPGDPDSQGFADVLMTEKPKSDEAAKASAEPDYDAHHAREITDRAICFINKNKDRPFFCYVAHHLVHRPEMEYGPRIIKYATKPEASNKMGNNPVLAAMVETLDAQVGRLLAALEESGIADNTLVVFFSDNGDLYGREGLKPYYGAKADLYEGGIRMPLIVRWPGLVKPGSESAEMVSSIDFFPTFAEIAVVKLTDPTVDGISILPALTQSSPLKRDTLYWHYPHYHELGIAPSGAIREGRYKLIEWFEKSIDGPKTDGALELFDLEADPGERHNLASQKPDEALRLYDKLRAWRKAVHAQEMAPNPGYDPAKVAKES
jgi:uncharacterized sulfatase